MLAKTASKKVSKNDAKNDSKTTFWWTENCTMGKVKSYKKPTRKGGEKVVQKANQKVFQIRGCSKLIAYRGHCVNE